jgi:hypothetical protein
MGDLVILGVGGLPRVQRCLGEGFPSRAPLRDEGFANKRPAKGEVLAIESTS